ncbi:hypothetical protein C1X05_13090 [Laceyella sacchari]|uniref:Uncharacterized protein n=1 Tax=Laceyella tengchongensis TaxID=574699 RepID=A0AA45WMP9_9BACL|nr:hypothetical protein [Laceyella tengchongensis]AUS09667.1 hypothetical protein C1X05_13090 [Laceyella sacchari]SMP14657.1 hypothetical protein SAMN06265361_102600 [Laceyella tengchongensis]
MAKRSDKGLQSHDHGLRVWEKLHHEYWHEELMEEIKAELEEAVAKMEAHMDEECVCGDSRLDVAFYREMLSLVQTGLHERNFRVLPFVEESLRRYVEAKLSDHKCLRHLLKTRHRWGRDVLNQTHGC